MPWLKVSDRFATHPIWARLRAVRGGDERTVNEVVGFVTRCATQASGHMTDYYVDLETAEMIGKGRTETLLRQAVHSGLLAVEGRGAARRWKIVEDEDLWQMRAREDVLWERQRQRDRRNPDLTMPVLRRDGDVCRYCGHVVNWKDTVSGRGGTFDHGNPGQPATLETYFVACKSCNSKRLDNPNADLDVPRLPAPAVPYFSPKSKSLEKLEAFFGQPIPHVKRPRPDSDTAQRDPAPSRTPRTTPRPATQADTAHPSRPATQADTASSTARPDDDTAAAPTRDTARSATPEQGEDTARSATPAPSWAGRPPDHSGTTAGTGVVEGWMTRSGRDGTGRAGPGTGEDGTGAAPRRRARRGKRTS